MIVLTQAHKKAVKRLDVLAEKIMKRLYVLKRKQSAVRRADAFARIRVMKSLQRAIRNPRCSSRNWLKEYESRYGTISRRTTKRMRNLRTMESKLIKQMRAVWDKKRAVYRAAGVDPSDITSAMYVERKRAWAKWMVTT